MADLIGPECRDEKHRNCEGDALDETTDEIVQCACGCHTFARLPRRRSHQRRRVVAVIRLDFTIPDGLWLSANDRRHWADKAKRTKGLRQLGLVIARNAKVGTLGTTHVAAFIGYPRNGRADPANAAPTVKALIDGMTDAGVWPDDDSTHVIGPTYLRGAKCATGTHGIRFVLTPQDVPWL